MIAHLERLRSRCAHFENFWSLWICGWMCAMLSVRMARSSAYAIVLHMAIDVLRWYHMLSFPSHLRSGSKKIIKM